MTPQQAQLVRESFESIRDLAGPLTQLFYGRLFITNPSLRALFRSDIRRQGEKLMAMVAAVVDSASNIEAVRSQLHDLGRAHADYGTEPAHYDAVTSAFLWALGQALEREFHPDVKQAWATLMQEVSEEMKRGAVKA